MISVCVIFVVLSMGFVKMVNVNVERVGMVNIVLLMVVLICVMVMGDVYWVRIVGSVFVRLVGEGLDVMLLWKFFVLIIRIMREMVWWIVWILIVVCS